MNDFLLTRRTPDQYARALHGAVDAVAADALTAAVSTAVETWDQSTTATLAEQRLVDWTAARIGFPAAGEPDGVFTSGGTRSNLQALFTAREDRLCGPHPTSRQERLGRLRIVAGEHAHFSVAKAAHLLGLSADAVLSVPADRGGRWTPSPSSGSCTTSPRPAGRSPPSWPPPGARTSAWSTRCPRWRTRAGATTCGCTWTPRTAGACSPRPPGGTCRTGSSGRTP